MKESFRNVNASPKIQQFLMDTCTYTNGTDYAIMSGPLIYTERKKKTQDSNQL